MGFPDNYTNLPGAKRTNRYQGTGNSWAVPVVEWIGERLIMGANQSIKLNENDLAVQNRVTYVEDGVKFFHLGKDLVALSDGTCINCTAIPEECHFSSVKDIVSPDAPEDIYISPVGCYGIIRRKRERNVRINPRLEEVLLSISSQMAPEEIEKRSRIQPRGRYSVQSEKDAVHQVVPQNKQFSETKQAKKNKALRTGIDKKHLPMESERLRERQVSFFDLIS